MKKIKFYILNIYRAISINGNRKKETTVFVDTTKDSINNDIAQAIKSDKLDFEANPRIQAYLAEKVKQKAIRNEVSQNSFAQLFLLLFQPRFIELKMATLALVLLFFAGNNPNNESFRLDSNQYFSKTVVCDTFPTNSSLTADSTFR